MLKMIIMHLQKGRQPTRESRNVLNEEKEDEKLDGQ